MPNLPRPAGVRPLIEVIGLPSPEQARRLVVLLGLAGTRPREATPAYRAASPAPSGHIYVLSFSDGQIKVGRANPGRQSVRTNTHRRVAERRGATLVDKWISPLHEGHRVTERRLIGFCHAQGGEPQGLNSEHFAGLNFDEVRDFAASLTLPTPVEDSQP